MHELTSVLNYFVFLFGCSWLSSTSKFVCFHLVEVVDSVFLAFLHNVACTGLCDWKSTRVTNSCQITRGQLQSCRKHQLTTCQFGNEQLVSSYTLCAVSNHTALQTRSFFSCRSQTLISAYHQCLVRNTSTSLDTLGKSYRSRQHKRGSTMFCLQFRLECFTRLLRRCSLEMCLGTNSEHEGRNVQASVNLTQNRNMSRIASSELVPNPIRFFNAMLDFPRPVPFRSESVLSHLPELLRNAVFMYNTEAYDPGWSSSRLQSLRNQLKTNWGATDHG